MTDKRKIDDNLYIDLSRIIAWNVTPTGIEVLFDNRHAWDFFGDDERGRERARRLELFLREVDESNEKFAQENGWFTPE